MKSQQGISYGLAKLYILYYMSFTGFTSAVFILSSEQVKVIKELRPLVTSILTHEYQKSDQYLIRFLQANDLNVDASAEMLKRVQEWRERNRMDFILNETFPEFSNSIFTDDGRDYEGRTVLTYSIGNLDIRKIIITGQRERYIRFNLQSIEKVVRKGAQTALGTQNDARLIVITDFNGYSTKNHGCVDCLQLSNQIRKLRTNYFPGFVAISVSINTPRIAMSLSLPLLMMDKNTEYKIFGTNRTEWTTYLQTIIPPNQLTYQFGGTKNI